MNWLNDRGTPRFERKFFFTGNYRGHGGMDWPQTGVEPLEGTQSEGFSPINGVQRSMLDDRCREGFTEGNPRRHR